MKTQKKITFLDWSTQWLDSIKGSCRDNSYYSTYYNIVKNHLAPFFEDQEIGSITQMHLQKFVCVEAEQYSRDTVEKCLHNLKRIFQSAVMNNVILTNPCVEIRIPQKIATEEKKVYTDEQLSLIENYASTHRFGLEIIILAETGMRRGELLGLKWTDIDFSNKCIHIVRAVANVRNSDTGKNKVVVGAPKNASSVRYIPISTMLCHYLMRFYKRKKSDYVICNKYKTVCSPSAWSQKHYLVFMREMREYYLEQNISIDILNCHNFRHTRASLWVNAGFSLYAIAKVMGWTDLEMLRKRYAHSNIDELRNLLNIS